MQAQGSRAAEWSWVLLAFVVANLSFAAAQPVHPREGLGDEGQIYHAMAKAMPRELPPPGAAPYVYRIGMPVAAATVAKSLDWVIAAGFDRLNLAFNALSVILLTILLRRHVPSVFARIVVVIAFIIEPHSPIRLTYLHPLSTDSVLLAGLLSGLLAIEWFASRPTPLRAGWLAMLVVIGVVFHELMLIIGVCVLFTRGLEGRSRFASIERTGAWLPLISGGLALAAVHAWIEPTPAGSSMFSELVYGFSAKSAWQLPLASFLVFGPMLVLPAYFWRSTARFLHERPMFLAYLALCVAWAWSSRDHIERGFALMSPIVYMLIARALATVPLHPAGAGMAGLLLVQGLSSRVFSPIGGPIETPSVLNEVWERLASADVSWALSYPNMWVQLCATAMVPAYLAWFGITGAGVLLLLRGSRGDAATPVEPRPPRAPWPLVAPKFVLVGIATAAALAPIVWLAVSRFYWDHYAQPGPAYLAYNLARVWLVAVLIGVFWATGSRISSGRIAATRSVQEDTRGRSIEYAVTGAAAWSIALVVLAAMHLYYLWLVLPLFAVATALAISDMLDRRVAASIDQPASPGWGIAGIVLRFSVALHAVAILFGIVLLGHFGGDNDVPGNYLPYYETVLRDHTIAAGSYWVHFFASKGNGLAFLGNLLSDVQGAGLATYAMLLLGAGMIASLVARSSKVAPAFGLIGAGLFLQYYAGQGAYAKSHIIRNLFVLYIVLSGARMLFFQQAIDAAGRAARLVVITAIIILSPLALVLLLPLLLIEWALLAWSRGGSGIRRPLIEAGWALGTTSAVCTYNFFQTGLPELHNMPSFMSRFVSIERFSRWIDPGVAYLDSRLAFLPNLHGPHAAATSATNLVPTQSFAQALAALMSPAVLALITGAMVTSVLAWLVARRQTADTRLPGAAFAIAYLLVVLVMLSALRTIGGGAGSSMGRFTDFANPVGIAIAVILLTAFWSADVRRRSQHIVAGLIAVTALIATYLGSAPIFALPWRSNVGFLVGQSSYASLNEFHWDTLTAHRIARSVPAGARVDMLNFLPGFTAIPDTPFQRPDGCVYLRDFTGVLYESPERVAAIYADHNIDHFLIDVSKDAPIVWSGFSELFTPESIRSRMKLVSHEQSATRDLYLLTWRNDPGASDDGFETFLRLWSDKLAVEKTGGAFYSAFVYGAQQTGRRE